LYENEISDRFYFLWRLIAVTVPLVPCSEVH
jgi:hypothetical protein